MKEDLLHFLWQHQYFNKKDLMTTEGEAIQVFAPGTKNTNAGPDFLNARLKIGDVMWFGNVEIHLRSSDWKNHFHHQNQAYENVILHVVWEEDIKISRIDTTSIPCLTLKDKSEQKLLDKYQDLKKNESPIPCAFHIKSIPQIIQLHVLDKSLISRLQRKSNDIHKLLESNQYDWEETCYQLLCQNFGFKLNAEPFLQLATHLPYKLIKKHSDNSIQVEALLFGMAGMLERKFDDDYPNKLKKEFEFLEHKYQLQQFKLDGSEWKFLRLRPANFPTVRIAQLASLICTSGSLFSLLTDFNSINDIKTVFQKAPSSYWCNHYVFGKPVSSKKTLMLGENSIENIIINTIVLLLAAYGKFKDQYELIEKAIGLLEELGPEENRIIREWEALGFSIETAANSQGAIELFNNYCKNKLCLNCSIGVSILKEDEEIYFIENL